MEKYCIVATDKKTNLREAIAGPFSKKIADEYVLQSWMKKEYKYFKVAKYPYSPRINGSKSL